MDTASGTAQNAIFTRLLAAAPIRTSATLTLAASTATGATYFSGAAIITGIQPGAQMEQLNSATINFEGTGALSFEENA
jgi:expansin (peptidoglycan-binding protein)